MPSNHHLLNYLTATNGPHKPQPTVATPILPSTPKFTIATSIISYFTQHNAQYSSTSRTTNLHLPHVTGPNHQIWMKTFDTHSTSSKESKTSIASTASDSQLWRRILINYNETLLKHLHGKLQVKTLHNISIPLPIVNQKRVQIKRQEETLC